MFHGCRSQNIELLRYLASNNIDFEAKCNEGNTPLHEACNSNFKEGILFLLLNGANVEEANNNGQKPGEGNMDMKMFLNNLLPESKAFNVLNLTQKKKLQSIFEDIDFDNEKFIDISKSTLFNKFIDPSLEGRMLEKDAKDFIRSCALCNKATVNLEEWILAFSKLFALDMTAYDKFVEDYESRYKETGSMKEFAIREMEGKKGEAEAK